ncbi:MAG: Lrp/AsnC family transcriptional regulator [Cyanobacteria bacterium P01_A01_bin.68]
MNSVLKLLLEGEQLSTSQMAQILDMSEAQVDGELATLKADKILLGWRPVLNRELMEENQVRAVIEIRITPERGGGFDKLAARISNFEQVESCYLMSGGYDLLAFVSGNNLHAVASFVSERLASIGGVLSTATHFLLRTYKEQGYILVRGEGLTDKPSVSP